MEQIHEWLRANQSLLGWLGLFSILFFVGTLIAIPIIIIMLPDRYLVENNNARHLSRGPLWFIPYVAIKNLIGLLFVAAGLVMLVLPGQGLLTLLIGSALIDFPGKRKLIRKIMGRAGILHAVNRLRAKANRPPLEIPED